MTKIPLPISASYVSHWTIYEALRELYQNAIDEQNSSNQQMISRYEEDLKMLTIGNYDTSLSKSTLVLGNSPKMSDDSQIGNFGEGYKLALVVLLRNKLKIRIKNGSELWIPSLEYNEDFQTDILTISIHPGGENPNHSVQFEITGIKPSVYNAYTQYNMHLQQDLQTIGGEDGEILLNERNKSKMFVEGLFICKMNEDFKYGYNFKAGIIPVDRDRMKLNSFDVKWRTSKMISKVEDDNFILDLIDEKTPDVTYIDSHLSDNDISEKLYKYFQIEHQNCIPVEDENSRERIEQEYDGVKAKVVGSYRFNLLRFSEEYQKDKSTLKPRYIPTPNEILIKFIDTYDELFSSALKVKFVDEIMTISKNWKIK